MDSIIKAKHASERCSIERRNGTLNPWNKRIRIQRRYTSTCTIYLCTQNRKLLLLLGNCETIQTCAKDQSHAHLAVAMAHIHSIPGSESACTPTYGTTTDE